jgi:hypothetical protein
VQRELPALDEDADAGEGHEIAKPLLDGGELEPLEVILAIAEVGTEALRRRSDQPDPLADEVAGRERLDVVGEGLDAAAAGVAEDHDVLHAQRLHGEFERRRGAVIFAAGLIGRDEIGDVADDEELARARVEDDLRRDPRVAAADDHDLGRLALGLSLEARPLARKALVEEGAVAGDQSFGEHAAP